MSSTPDTIRADIERTRSELSSDVDALGEAVRPGNLAREQVGRLSSRAGDLKDRLMGSASSALDSGSDAATGLKDQAAQGPAQVGGRTRSNPLAMGVIALGAGWLLGSLIPGTRREADLASSVKAGTEPLVTQVQQAAQESLEHLREPAQDAAAAVTDRAKEALDTVTEQGQDARSDVEDSAAGLRQG